MFNEEVVLRSPKTGETSPEVDLFSHNRTHQSLMQATTLIDLLMNSTPYFLISVCSYI